MKSLHNNHKTIAILFIVIVAYIIGFYKGEKSVIYEQTIYNEYMEEGNYFSEYHGDIHWYYYER